MTRIIVAGSRGFNDYQILRKTLDSIIENINDEIEIVSGTARGADKLGELYAYDNNLLLKRFPADWNLYGKRAGYLRNKQMAEYAAEETGMAVVFWDGESRGSKHMIDLAEKCGLIVKIIYVKERAEK